MMIYLLQVSSSWIVFYAIYLLFLRKETFFNINRYFLMGALIIGLLIPFLGAFLPENQASVDIYQVMTQVSAVEITSTTAQNTAWFTWWKLIYLLYAFGAAIVFARFVYGLRKIYMYYIAGNKSKFTNYTLVESNEYHLPFSFFKFIFISKQLPLNNDIERVLKHEELHASQWHSFDIIILELLQVFFWFNPILVFYKKSLKQSHEFLADAYVTKDHNRNSYGQLLLRQSSSGLEIALANHFFHSQIKQRITMMYKEKSKRQAMVKYLLALPVLLGLLIVFASNKAGESPALNKDCVEIQVTGDDEYSYLSKSINISEIEAMIKNKLLVPCVNLKFEHYHLNTANKITKLADQYETPVHLHIGKKSELIEASKDLLGASETIEVNIKQNEEVYKVVEEMPRFPGCEDMSGTSYEKEKCSKQKMLEFVYQNIKYPATARDKGVEGMCIIQFIVEKDGSISGGKIARDIGAGCGEEALKAVNTMPTWIPGKQRGKAVRVQYTFPVKFKLTSDEPVNPKVVVVGYGEKSDEAIKKNLNIKEASTTEQTSDSDIFKVVEEMPRFYGCEHQGLSGEELKKCSTQKMLEYIYTNIKYPKEAREQGIEGMVVVQLIIEKDGSVTSTEVKRDPGGGTGTEAKRVIENMPNWIPGKQKGKNVRVQMVLPIRYKLDSQNEKTNDDKSQLLPASKQLERTLNIKDFNINPNPTSGIFTLSFSTESKSTSELSFYSITGKLLKNIKNVATPYDNNIDLTEFRGQTVFIKVVQDGKIYTDKLVVH